VTLGEREFMIAMLAMVTRSNESAFENMTDEELEKQYVERVENR
jgi:hypothetical protein